jgi:hypothetical protein
MDSISSTGIKSFASAQQADYAPDTEQFFVLSSKDLQAIIKEATEPLRRELAIQTMRLDDAFEAIKDIDNTITITKQIKPQPLQEDRGELLRALLVSNGGKILAKDARRKMHLSESVFSRLIRTMKDIEIRPYHLKQNQNLLVLRSKLLARKEQGV